MFVTFGSGILLPGIYPKETMRKTIKDLWQGCLSWGENVINQREMAEPIPIVQCDAGFVNGIQRIRCTIIIIFRWKNKICNYVYIYDPNFILKWHIHARLEANTAKCYYSMGSLKKQDYKSFLFTRSKFPRFFFFFWKISTWAFATFKIRRLPSKDMGVL